MGGHRGRAGQALAIDSVETFILGSLKWFTQFKGKDEDNVLADFQRALGQADVRCSRKRPGIRSGTAWARR